MKIGAMLLFLSLTTATVGQNEVHKVAADPFLKDFNSGNYERIYQSYSIQMKQSRTKNYHLGFLASVKRSRGALLFLSLTDFQQVSSNKVRGYYIGTFDKSNVRIRISTNRKGEIVGLYIKNNDAM